MYRASYDESQQVFENFYLPLGGQLDVKNRWIVLARLVL